MEPAQGIVKVRPDWRGAVRHVFGAALDMLYPPTCLNCGAPIAEANAVCAACFRQMQPITAPLCPRLGLPFAANLGPDALCAEAIADPPPFQRARAAFVYDDISRRFVSRLKYGDRPDLARFCGRTMVSAAGKILNDDPVLVPVPLHKWRQIGRRYNQSVELCRAIVRQTGLEMAAGFLRRTRATPRQVGLSAEARKRNVKGAFSVHPSLVSRFAGRRIVIVDDVMTTGATARAATLALNKAGFNDVDIVTFARVVIGADTTI